MRQLKEGMRVIYKLDVELDDGEYNDEEDEWITEPTTQTFRLRGRIVKYTPNPCPDWWDYNDSLRFVMDNRLPSALLNLGFSQPTTDDPWYVHPENCEEVRTFRDWVRGLK